MEVWIFLGLIHVAGQAIYIAPGTAGAGLQYAFTSQKACEWAINHDPELKCFKVKLIDASDEAMDRAEKHLQERK